MNRPLAELHVHLEGTVPPALIQRLADRNGLKVPEGVFATPEKFKWVDFLDFLRTYDLAASVIRTQQDYRDITYEYLMSCAREGAIYVELIASPDHARSVGLTDAEHYDGIAAGIDDARRDGDIEARILIAAIRNFGVAAAIDMARRHAEDRHPYVVGFNLAGDEAGYPAAAVRRGVRDRRRLRPWLHGARRRARRRVLGPGRARPAGQPDLTRRARDRGSGAGGGDRGARDRARSVPDVERRDRRVRQL